MRRIYVKELDYGFFSEKPVTVQVIDWHKDEGDGYKDILWCNHAEAEEEVQENEIPRVDQPDICWTSRVLVCAKCGAYQHEGENYWYDAPFNGITRD